MTGRSHAVAGSVLLAAGLGVLTWLGWSLLRPAPAPYEYALVEQGKASEFPGLGLEAWPELPVRTYELRGSASPAQAFAVVHASRDERGNPVLLQWRSQVAEPVVTQTAPVQELAAVARAIADNTPPDALLLAWWDTSKQLALLTDREVLFDQHLAKPLLLPAAWRGRRDAIESLERRFWRAKDDDASARFDQYVDALLQDTETGAAKLASLAGSRSAYLVLHVGDALKVGAMRPDALGIGYRDFPSGAQVHGLIQRAKAWLQEQGYRSYTVDASDPTAARVYYLTEEPAETTLLAQALAFNTSNPVDLAALTLVYQRGGYWVYRVPDIDGSPAGSTGKTASAGH